MAIRDEVREAQESLREEVRMANEAQRAANESQRVANESLRKDMKDEIAQIKKMLKSVIEKKFELEDL